MNTLTKVSSLVLLGALAIGPLHIQAQNTNQPPVGKKHSSENQPSGVEKKPVAGPFHGKLAKVDQTAKTITVGKRTFLITSETKLKKGNGSPATLADATVGEEVSGYVKPTEAGKLAATVVTFGPKTGGKSAEKQKSHADTNPK